MMEGEWLACDDPKALLAFVRRAGVGSVRKWRLFASACCRGAWPWLADDRTRRAVEGLERLAEGTLTGADPNSSLYEVTSPTVGTTYLQREPGALPYVTVGSLVSPTTIVCLIEAMKVFNEIHAERSGVIVEVSVGNAQFVEYQSPLFRLMPALDGVPASDAEKRQAGLVRDVFSFASRRALPTTFSTPDVLELAQAAYTRGARHSGDLDAARLAVLSDALEDAGCTDDAILSHLRSPGPDVRGCWALDLILGK